MKTTKGNWDTRQGESGDIYVQSDEANLAICKLLKDSYRQYDEMISNAKLIAAAPDLFEALVPFSELKGRSVLELNEMMRKAQSAIKKAIG